MRYLFRLSAESGALTVCHVPDTKNFPFLTSIIINRMLDLFTTRLRSADDVLVIHFDYKQFKSHRSCEHTMNSTEYYLANNVLLWVFSLILCGMVAVGLFPVRIACTWRAKYGIECATCHLTRALERLSTGDFFGSIKEHKGAVVLVGFLVVQVGFRTLVKWRQFTSCKLDVIITSIMLMVLWWGLNARV